VFEAMHLAFEAVAKGTLAEEATLKLEEERLTAMCRSCGHEYKPTIQDFLCPKCATADAQLIAGQDIVLKSVVCETEEEATSA
jgi:hydrogenase nickel incorporation protein HypA/HybF